MLEMGAFLFVLLISSVYGDDQLGSTASPYDTIVVGLGSAGCTAASTLAQAGKRVLALEAQGRVGGRVNTVPQGNGVVELGAEWIHGTQNSRVYDLAVQNNISVLAQGIATTVYRSDGSLADQDLMNNLTEYTLSITDDTSNLTEPFGQFATKRIAEYLRANYSQLLEDKQFLEDILFHMELIVDSYEASNSWNDLSTQSHYEALGGYLYTSWHIHGYKTFFELLLNTYKNGPGYPSLDVKLNKEVTQISWPQEPSQPVVVTCRDGTLYRANNVIVTVSLGVLKERYQSLFSQQLPKAKVTAIEKISMGVLDKVVLTFSEVWWSGITSFAFLWRAADRATIPKEDIWTTKAAGLSASMGSNNSLEIWFSGEDAKLVETLPDELVKTKMMGLLRRFMGANMTIPEPVSMIRSKWYTNPFTRGSYTYDNIEFPLYPTARSDLGQPLLDSAGKPRVLFAGEATNPTHYGTVHGASETGYREAMRLLAPAIF